MFRILTLILAVFMGGAAGAQPLRIEITDGVIEPMPFAAPRFIAQDSGAMELSGDIVSVLSMDLMRTGLFRALDERAHIGKISSLNAPVEYADWKAINAQVLVTGAVATGAGGELTVSFRIHDVFAGQEYGKGLKFKGKTSDWRRMAHKVADEVYSRITGESGYFDSRVVFVAESGTKGQRRKRLAIMDYDGEQLEYIDDGAHLVLAPRIAPDGQSVLFTGYETGFPRIYQMDLRNKRRKLLQNAVGTTSFAPRFSPDGTQIVYSQEQGGNTDLFVMSLRSGQARRLTSAPSIETAPSFAPDGTQIVFESDRSGSQQLYVMNANGEGVKRISFGDGRYGTPVWSPRGDMIAFTKQSRGRFHIGVMRVDGSEERLLTASFLDEGPTWSPNGRVIMFTRETQGVGGVSNLYSVDVSGRNLQRVATPSGGSDPTWSPLRR